MPEVAYVSDESSKRGREFEARIQALPPAAGILCVGVLTHVALGGDSRSYTIYVGIARPMEVETGMAVVKQVLDKEMRSGLFAITVHVFRAVQGSYRDQASPGPGPFPA